MVKNPSHNNGNGQGGTQTMEYAVMIKIGRTQHEARQKIGVGQVSQKNKEKRVNPLVFEKQAGTGLEKSDPG